MSMKTCKMCRSEINSLAKKCPYCRHWQNKLTMMIWHPAFAVVLIILLYFLLQAFWMDQFGPGKDFDIDKSKISIKDTTMQFGENKCGQTVVILGKIENLSHTAWKNIHFEINFFDKDKNLIDTDQEEIYEFLLPVNEQVPFKVSVNRQFPEELYSSFDIRILTAREKGMLF